MFSGNLSKIEKRLDRLAVPLDVKVGDAKTGGGLTTEYLSFASRKHADGKIKRVPVLRVRQVKADKRFRAVIALLGAGSSSSAARLAILLVASFPIKLG